MFLTDLRPGTVVATGISWTPFYHVGLLTSDIANGVPTVISNSQRNGGVAEEPMADFGDVGSIRVLGYWSDLNSEEVLQRARRYLGSKWSLTGWNCEHFVRAAHAVKVESPQLRFWLSIVGITALAAVTIKMVRGK